MTAETASAAPLVELRTLTQQFARPPAPPVLAGVNLRVERGEFISLIGASGCGKATLLRLLAGLTVPSAGQVLIEGRPATAAVTERAFLFQDAALLPWRTVRHNVELLLQLRGTPASLRRERAARLLELARIGHLAHRHPRQLSGGEKMRVSLARALTLEPALLLLDEPFGALDELTREVLGEELLALRTRQQWTAFFVTHSVAEAVFLSTRILILAGGAIAHDLPVNLAFPRNAETRESAAFLHQVGEVSRLLRTAVPASPAS